ncbi:MAG: GSCFA domain-containing protein [Bacteroidetes bacterium]|nr:GSCFA domain-containing protein [Bacteroidota bacterium]
MPQTISVRQPLLLLGSCFAEEIGARLRLHQFKALCNPHGILYNPVSIAHSLHEVLFRKEYQQSDVFLQEDLWCSFSHHGQFSHPRQADCLQHINHSIFQAHQHLQSAEWLVVTFGSAFAYTHQGRVVANCHKIPSRQFIKKLLSKEEIVSVWQQQLGLLQQQLPNIKVLFTVSPVRYLRDGLAENNRSKGILIDAVHSLIEQNPFCFYFPSYEIVIDELRDYRFFKEDGLHPNELALNYVWKKWMEACFDEETQQFLREYESLLKNKQHKLLHLHTPSAQAFLTQVAQQEARLKKKYPFF